MKSAINLLPAVYRRQLMLRRRVVEWTTVTCVVLLAMWVARSYKLREYHALSQRLEAVAREGRLAQAMLTEITSMREQLQQLQHQEAIAKELEQHRPLLPVLGLVSQAAEQSGGQIRVTQFKILDLQTAHTNSRRRNNDSQLGALTLVGVSLDGPAVAEFHEALLRSGLFADVRFIKSNERDEGNLAMYEYEIRCEM